MPSGIPAPNPRTGQPQPAWRRALGWSLVLAAASTCFLASAAVVDPYLQAQLTNTPNGKLRLAWPATPGGIYQLHVTTDLNSPDWTPAGAPIQASGAQASFELEPAGIRRFIRLVQVSRIALAEDFEQGAGAWQLETGWDTETDGSSVLRGEGHYWARLEGNAQWTDYRLRLHLKLIAGGIHLNFRMNDRGRYFIGFAANGINLHKQYWPAVFLHNLAFDLTPFSTGTWHSIEIVGTGDIIEIWLDGEKRITYQDPDPLLAGTIAFETHDNSRAHLDDIVVETEPALLPDPNLVWTRTGGPLGGIGYDVRVRPDNPRMLYVTDAFSGVSRSEDAGATWTPANEGITSRTGASGDSIPVFCLTIDPKNPDVLWIGTQGMRGVYRSTNGGKSWIRSENGIPGIPGMTFRSFTIDPNDSNTVYAGVEIPTAQPGPDGRGEARGKIFKTTNAGTSWFEVLDTGALVRWMAIDPTDSRTLYAATGIFDRDDAVTEGILKSTDGGATWFHINQGLPNLTVGALVMDPRNPQVLYAGTGRHNGFGGGPSAAHGGVFKTTNGGTAWVEVLHRPNDYFPVTAMALAPSLPDTVYVAAVNRFYRSENGGVSWSWFPLETDGASVGIPIALSVDPSNPNVLYLNSYIGGVFKSSDGGRTWDISSQGYTGAQISDVGTDLSQPSRVYALGRMGVASSDTAGREWRYLNRDATQGFLEGAGLSVHPANPNDLLIANRMNGFVFRTTDGGEHWEFVHDAFPRDSYPANVHGLVQFSRNSSYPEVIYAAGRMAAETWGINSWTRSIGVLKSTDGGSHWMPTTNGLPADLNINAVSVHPTDPNVVLAGTLHDGVYRTTNGGLQWAKLGHAFAEDVRAVRFDLHNPAVLYAGAERLGFFVSTNSGQTWRNASTGMEPNGSIRAIAVDPARPMTLWAADIQSGVYRSTNQAAHWQAVNAGLRTRAVTCLAISADGNVLYAGTDGEGVFRVGKVTGTTSLGGLVRSADGPVPGALVQIQTTTRTAVTDTAGRFRIQGLEPDVPVRVTAWAPGYYIAGGASHVPGQADIVLEVRRLPHQDHPDYRWLSAYSSPAHQAACQNCHSVPGQPSSALPFDEWRRDAHGTAAQNPRFLSMYAGTDLQGRRSPLTRFVVNPEYGRVPLPPDPDQPYYGPGYRLDFPNSAGNCATCHTPAAIDQDPFGTDPTTVAGVGAEGVTCDLCHKIQRVRFDPATRLPDLGRPGVLSMEFLRPPPGEQVFFGPYTDVAPGDDTFLPLQRQSQLCAPCHFGVFWGTVIYNSYGEWLDSPYSDPVRGQTCQDCHMPTGLADHFARFDQGGQRRSPATIFSHRMPGASDLNLLQHAVRLEVTGARAPGIVEVETAVTNDRTGHHVPTDSPLRHMILLVRAQGSTGNPAPLLEGPRLPDWVGQGDPAEGCFAGLPGKVYAKVLEELWTGVSPTGAYWNPTLIVSDSRLPAFATDRGRFTFEVPVGEPLTVTVTLLFRRAYKDLMTSKGWSDPDVIMAERVLVF